MSSTTISMLGWIDLTTIQYFRVFRNFALFVPLAKWTYPLYTSCVLGLHSFGLSLKFLLYLLKKNVTKFLFSEVNSCESPRFLSPPPYLKILHRFNPPPPTLKVSDWFNPPRRNCGFYSWDRIWKTILFPDVPKQPYDIFFVCLYIK